MRKRRTNEKAEMLNATESALRIGGFQISKRCRARASCFSITARKNNKLIFVNISPNLGKVPLKDAAQLEAISHGFSAAALIVGKSAREKQLENDTVYTRWGIYAVTLKTFEDVILRQMNPLIAAGPGGYYVQLNGEAIRKKRQELGLSMGKLAEQLKISRRALYGHERELTKASVSVAYNLEWSLGIPVVKPIDIFRPMSLSHGFFATAKRIIIKNRFLQNVLKILVSCHFKVKPTPRAPFDFIAQCHRGETNIIGGVPHSKEKNVHRRAAEILSISEIVNARPLFITDGEFAPENGIPFLNPKELQKIKIPEDLLSRL